MGSKKTTKKKSTNPTYHGYSYGFKVGVVEQVENGQLSANQAARLHGVYSTAIRRWVKKYGNLDEKLLRMPGKSPKQEIVELKKKLRRAESERDLWRVAVDIIEDEFGIDVKKKVLVRIRQDFLEKTEKRLNITMMADQFGISTSGYYKHINKKKISSSEDDFIINEVNKIRQLMPRIGTRKLHHMLNPLLKSEGLKYGRDKLFDLLRKEVMLVPRRTNYLTTTRSYKRIRKHPNIIADLNIRRPEQVWVLDITYIRTKDGFQYLTLITDAYSKKIMGYHLADNMKTENNVKALKMALNKRRYPKRRLIHHSDRGFQYCADEYIKKLEEHKIKVSMTTKFDPYENAVAERVNGILKQEFLISDTRIPKEEAYYIIKQSIETYNKLRPHYSCEYLTPDQAHSGRKFKMKTYITGEII